MKTGRSMTVVVIGVLAIAVILVFLYEVPSGRRARREALRGVRMARNATGIYPLPVVRIKMWRDTLLSVVLIEVYESGRLVVSGRGQRIERELTRDELANIVETGRAAFGDFSSSGCGTERLGLNAELYLLVNGAWLGSVCRGGLDWPRGLETRRLFAEVERYVPGAFDDFLPAERR